MARTYEETRNMGTAGRLDLRLHTRWKSAAWAGLVAGVVFMMLEMMMTWMFMGDSPWAPPRMIAAMVMGKGVLPPPANFDFAIIMVAMMIHLMLSIVYGLLLGWIVHRMEMGAALVTGAVFGLVAAYLVNFYLIAPILFPWFVMARNWISVFTHVMFGVTAAGVYISLRNRHAAA